MTYNGQKLNKLEQFEIRVYRHHKAHKNDILNDQITYNDRTLYIMWIGKVPKYRYHKNRNKKETLIEKWSVLQMKGTNKLQEFMEK
jgi:hypothetical protein